MSERGSDTDQLVYGNAGEGRGDPSEIVVEVLIRDVSGLGKKRGVERVLEGWSTTQGPCELSMLVSLNNIMGSKQLSKAVRAFLPLVCAF